MFYLSLNNMEFDACHGVLPEEKETPQKYIVDVRIETDQIIEAASTDNICDALNYVGVYKIVHDVMMKKQWNLIETIAMKICTEIVENYETIICVDTRITKVNPPIEGFSGNITCEYSVFGAAKEDDGFYDLENDFEYEDQDGNIISFPRL